MYLIPHFTDDVVSLSLVPNTCVKQTSSTSVIPTLPPAINQEVKLAERGTDKMQGCPWYSDLSNTYDGVMVGSLCYVLTGGIAGNVFCVDLQ